jgi:DNA-directed RNA polymerase subunit RPC12/RpoP
MIKPLRKLQVGSEYYMPSSGTIIEVPLYYKEEENVRKLVTCPYCKTQYFLNLEKQDEVLTQLVCKVCGGKLEI